MEQDEPNSKKFKTSIITDIINDVDFQEIFFKHWHNYTAVKTQYFEIIPKPFRICKIFNFLKNTELMEEIKNELLDVKSRRNSIDLYQFEQTDDLANADSKNLKNLFETFQTDLVSWMEYNTKIKLNNKLSISSSCYSDTDYLLCHDDNMGDRRIAFILYLSDNWEAEDGGALELFDTDEDGHPRNVVQSLIPEYNSLVFFEVTDNSFHQVAEITSPEKCRWSINGWFHGPLIDKDKPQRLDLEPVAAIEPENTQIDLKQWINKSYLVPDIIKDIQINMEYESYSFLTDFILPDVYEDLSREIINESIRWQRVGPANQRNYEIAEEESLPGKLRELCKLFKSLTMCELLKKYTELDLVPETVTMKPTMRIEIQRWKTGCYTLISDYQINDSMSSTTDRRSVTNLEIVEDNNQGDEGANFDQGVIIKPGNSYLGEGENYLGEVVNTPPSSGDEEESEVFKRVFNGKLGNRTRKGYLGPHQATSSDARAIISRSQLKCGSDSEEADIEENVDDEVKGSRTPKRKNGKLINQATSSKMKIISPSKFEMNRGTDSEESDIDDYLSDPNEHDEDDDFKSIKSTVIGSLDVIMQFHSSNAPECVTIDYVNPKEESALIHVPSKDNHLCLVFRTSNICRVHNYVNHYCKGYYYNLLCSYTE